MLTATASATGLILTALSARAHYLATSERWREVFWFVLAFSVSLLLTPLIVSAFSWNGGLQFIFHAGVVVAAAAAVAVYRRHEVRASTDTRAAAYAHEWSAIALSLCFAAFSVVMGYIVLNPVGA